MSQKIFGKMGFRSDWDDYFGGIFGGVEKTMGEMDYRSVYFTADAYTDAIQGSEVSADHVAATIDTDGKAKKGSDGDPFVFCIEQVTENGTASSDSDSNYWTIPDEGYAKWRGLIEVPYDTGNAPTVGAYVCVNGAGKIRKTASTGSATNFAAGAVKFVPWMCFGVDTTNKRALIGAIAG